MSSNGNTKTREIATGGRASIQLGNFRVHTTGLIAEDNPSFEEWEALGKTLQFLEGAIQWAIGDWINYGEGHWREKYAQALDAFEYDYGTLRDFAWVSRVFDLSLRSDKCSYTHHKELAKISRQFDLSPDKLRRYLTVAARDALTVARLKALVQEDFAAEQRALRLLRAEKANPVGGYVHGDCLEELSALPPKSVRLLITDPPYGMAFQSNRRTASAKAAAIEGDDTPEKALELFSAMLEALKPALMDECHLLVFCTWRYEPLFRTLLEQSNFDVDASVIWVKDNHTSGDLDGFAPKHERILHARRGTLPVGPRVEDVLIVRRENATTHPTEKPVHLLTTLIECTTTPGELVVDPFAGTASTVVAALRTGRRVFAVELDGDWYAEGLLRLNREETANALSH